MFDKIGCNVTNFKGVFYNKKQTLDRLGLKTTSNVVKVFLESQTRQSRITYFCSIAFVWIDGFFTNKLCVT